MARRIQGGPAILASGPSLLLTLELPQQCLVRGMRAQAALSGLTAVIHASLFWF